MSSTYRLQLHPETGLGSTDAGTTGELVSLRDTAARVVRARHGGSDGEDLVQEAWARVALALRDRPIDDPHAYTAGIAANLVRGRHRQDRRHQRWAPRLFVRPTIDAPDGVVVRQTEGDALATALSRLPQEARAVLVAHVVDGIDTIALAERAQTTPGAVAACLARARAMLRVEYLIAFRHLPDPPERCRRICYAVSANDTRRELRLGASSHLETCEACREVVDTLRERRRPAMLGALALRLAGWSGRAAGVDWQQSAPRVGLVGAGVVGAIALGSVLAPRITSQTAVPTVGVQRVTGVPAAVTPHLVNPVGVSPLRQVTRRATTHGVGRPSPAKVGGAVAGVRPVRASVPALPSIPRVPAVGVAPVVTPVGVPTVSVPVEVRVPTVAVPEVGPLPSPATPAIPVRLPDVGGLHLPGGVPATAP